MRYFHNDYNQMCHQRVLEKLTQAQGESVTGYGMDSHCSNAADLVKKLCQRSDISVHFLVGGTQTNLTVIAAALRPHQGVICPVSGHINVHETGAIEATGHKVIGLPSQDGKITAAQVAAIGEAHLSDNDREHTVMPKMVYISNSTEYGTVYTLAELEELSAVCKKYGYYLFMDGARLGYALASIDSDLSMADIARLTDVFYIGMTKCGAIFGEIVVIANPALSEDFRYLIKQRGAMLAKGWLLGLQAEALLEDDLYFHLGKQANDFAQQVCRVLEEKGYPLYLPCCTNQIFPILPNGALEKLKEQVTFLPMDSLEGDRRVIRLCTSWATTQEDMDILCKSIRNL